MNNDPQIHCPARWAETVSRVGPHSFYVVQCVCGWDAGVWSNLEYAYYAWDYHTRYPNNQFNSDRTVVGANTNY